MTDFICSYLALSDLTAEKPDTAETKPVPEDINKGLAVEKIVNTEAEKQESIISKPGLTPQTL